MKKRLKGKCPCGYIFKSLLDENNAVLNVQSHYINTHKELLPFGITYVEALALLEKEVVRRKKITTANEAQVED